MAGLRERWRRNAIRVIQERALDLFDERGFTAVTIEQIATAAEVSPSSVYRYFGTKEGLLVADEFDVMDQEALAELLDPDDPVGSLLTAVRAYESAPSGPDSDRAGADAGAGAGPRGDRSPWRRVRYFFTEPSVRTAVCASLDRASQRIGPLLAAGGRLSEAQARVAANALAFGYLATLEQWYLDGGERPIADYVEEGLEPLRGIWPGADRPAPGSR